MGVTRRYLGEAGLVVSLTGLAVLLAQPFLLVGGGGLAGYLLARQLAFVRDVSRIADDIEVVLSPDRAVVEVGDEVAMNLTVSAPRESRYALDVETELPVGVDTADDRGRVSLAPGDRTAGDTFAVRPKLSGEFTFDPPTVTVTEPSGRFRATFAAGAPANVVVEPSEPGNLHVGVAGEALDAPYGDNASDETGPGIDLAEIRAYVPGDEIRQIDWKATARFDEPHVREFEADTQRRTTLLLDCRPSMAAGPDGETKFEHARQLALGFLQHARDNGEAIGAYSVGREGLLARHPPSASTEAYARLERHLDGLEVRDGGDRTEGGDDVSPSAEAGSSPGVARRRFHRLKTDDSAFAERLRPYFAESDPYVERVADDPLYGVARSHFDRFDDAMTAVIVTDDRGRAETRQAVKLARRHADDVVVFFTPSALFDDDGTDLEAAYRRYADFERFRRELAGLDRVAAFEVGPEDRLESVLAASGGRQRAGTGD